jgi:RNA polymerase sigma-70 factor (ECF subfamily)
MGDEMLSVLRATRPMPDANELDPPTIARAAAGERNACRALVQLYQVRVFALVTRMLPGRDRATIEDTAQETFLDVFRRLREFRVDGPARLSTWILTIAVYEAIDELRRLRPSPRAHVEVATTARTDDATCRREVRAAIEAALVDLPPDMRAAFILREYHDLEYSEVAEALAIDIGTVKSRLARARAALRDRLAEVHDA